MIETVAAIYVVRSGARFVLHNEGEPSESIEWLDSVLTETTSEEVVEALQTVRQRERGNSIKDECSQIIVSHVHEKDQRNLTALSVRHLKWERGGGGAPPTPPGQMNAQLDMIDDSFDWIQAMKEESRRAIADGNDPAWPAWDDAWNVLIRLGPVDVHLV